MLRIACEKLLRTLFFPIWGTVGHRLLGPKLRSPPGCFWADHARWAMCPDEPMGQLFPTPAPRILDRDPTLGRPCVADNGHRMDFALHRWAMLSLVRPWSHHGRRAMAPREAQPTRASSRRSVPDLVLVLVKIV